MTILKCFNVQKIVQLIYRTILSKKTALFLIQNLGFFHFLRILR